ncbi:MAG: acyl-CoA synthetase (AMP-forming)/AMP-acid ligase II, partial [Lentimonas sp.]
MSKALENIIARFQSIVAEYPDNTAYKYLEEGKWHKADYASLLKDTIEVASMLSELGVQRGDAVLLPSTRTPALFAELLGILWVGGHYVFLDPSYPEERQNLICETTGARIGIFTGKLPDFKCAGVDWHPVLTGDYSGETIDVCDDPELPAYVMFTSGSTGKPKGVVIPRRGIT